MSEEETCDNCGATGRRRRGTIVPENWPGKLDLTDPLEYGTRRDLTAAPAFCGFPPLGDDLPERLEVGLALGLEPDGDGAITRERILEFAASLRAP